MPERELILTTEYYRLPLPDLGELVHQLRAQDPIGYKRYLDAMDQTNRWQGGDQPMYPFTETVLEHVAAGYHVLDCIKMAFPELAKVIEVHKVADIFFVHDGGETVVCDIANTDPILMSATPAELNQNKKNKDRREKLGFLIGVLPLFDPMYRPILLQIFSAYENRAEQPLPISEEMAKWIDIIVGNQIALDYFYPEYTEATSQRVKKIALNKFFKHTQRVYNLLTQLDPEMGEDSEGDEVDITKVAQLQFLNLAKSYLNPFIRVGYTSEIASFQAEYRDLFTLMSLKVS
jgi:hypothetical protein